MLKRMTLAGMAASLMLLPMLATDDSAEANGGHGPVPYVQKGTASWYGPGFHGKTAASGERFNQHDLTAAHRELPMGTRARVTNLRNGRTVDVEINDRGPYVGGRIIDLSKAAAERLEMKRAGTTPVRLEVIGVLPVAAARGS